MKNIVVISLNPCIDRLYTVPTFTFGGLNRVKQTRSDVAGKGINVAVALKNLGLDPLCAGFNFTENGDILTEELNTRGVRHDFVEARGAIRVNIKLYEEESGLMTELNQSGDFVSEEIQDALLKKIEMSNSEILILSGSLPQGVPANFYARICEKHRGLIFLDTSGEPLLAALNNRREHIPYAIKPNLFELEQAYKTTVKKNDIPKLCREEIISRGVKIVCVSMGADGAVLVTENGAYFCPALPVEAKGVAGAGDAMVAGLVYAAANNLPESDLLPSAMAAAAASVTLDGTQMCTRDGFEVMLKLMPEIERI